jgi:hypothetical protein
MPVVSYQGAVRVLQPVIVPIFDALQEGLDRATEMHARSGIRRETDRLFFLYSARRFAYERLAALGLAQTADDGDRSVLGLSGLLLLHDGLMVRVLRPDVDATGRGLVPLPGHSEAKRAFYRQEPLPGLVSTDNVVLSWLDKQGAVEDPMILARPVGGDFRRDSLLLSWQGPLSRDMARLRAKDLDELQPEVESRMLDDLG